MKTRIQQVNGHGSSLTHSQLMLDSLVPPMTLESPNRADRRTDDYLVAARQCFLAFMAHSSVTFPILLSYLPLFVSFVSFLIWNQGIVLGASYPYQAHREATKATTLPDSTCRSFYIVERSLQDSVPR